MHTPTTEADSRFLMVFTSFSTSAGVSVLLGSVMLRRAWLEMVICEDEQFHSSLGLGKGHIAVRKGGTH